MTTYVFRVILLVFILRTKILIFFPSIYFLHIFKGDIICFYGIYLSIFMYLNFECEHDIFKIEIKVWNSFEKCGACLTFSHSIFNQNLVQNYAFLNISSSRP